MQSAYGDARTLEILNDIYHAGELKDEILENITRSRGSDLLDLAIRNDRTDLCKMILDEDYSKILLKNSDALVIAAEKGYLDIVHKLLEMGVDVNYKRSHDTALILGVNSGSIEIVNLLIDAGARVNDLGLEGVTALIESVWTKNPNIVETLLRAGANVNYYDKNGNTALMEAAEEGNPKIVETLLLAGADVNHRRFKS